MRIDPVDAQLTWVGVKSVKLASLSNSPLLFWAGFGLGMEVDGKNWATYMQVVMIRSAKSSVFRRLNWCTCCVHEWLNEWMSECKSYPRMYCPGRVKPAIDELTLPHVILHLIYHGWAASWGSWVKCVEYFKWVDSWVTQSITHIFLLFFFTFF